MGTSNSKEEEIDTAGSVNNNIIIKDAVTVQSQEIMYLLIAGLVVKAIELLIFIYLKHRKHLRNKYSNNNNQNANANNGNGA